MGADIALVGIILQRDRLPDILQDHHTGIPGGIRKDGRCQPVGDLQQDRAADLPAGTGHHRIVPELRLLERLVSVHALHRRQQAIVPAGPAEPDSDQYPDAGEECGHHRCHGGGNAGQDAAGIGPYGHCGPDRASYRMRLSVLPEILHLRPHGGSGEGMTCAEREKRP